MEKPKAITDYNADDPSEVAAAYNINGVSEVAETDGPTKAKFAKLSTDTALSIEFNPILTRKEITNTLISQWNAQTKEDFKDSDTGIQIFTEPFQIGLLPNFLKTKAICSELVDEMVDYITWSRKQMDLYEFYQSTDLSNLKHCPFLTNFLQMLRRNVRPWLEKVTNLKLDYVSASCSMYTCGDYLLVHDDLLKDRQVAFVYYLSPWDGAEQWAESQGGCLEIFNSDEQCFPQFPVRRKIPPRNNQFAFFKVGPRSFHQVGEVTSFDYPRLTINGWFHGASNETEIFADSLRPVMKLNFQPPLRLTDLDLNVWINNTYLKPNIRTAIQKRIEENSETCLYEFLNNEIFNEVTKQLLDDKTLVWCRQGPANAQNYEILELESATKSVAKIIELFSCQAMFELLRDYTDLDLAGTEAKTPSCSIELQRWSHGNYTVLGDGAICEESTLDLIYYLNADKGAGIVTYLSPEDDHQAGLKLPDDTDDEDDDSDVDESVLLTITPIDNALNMIYRCEGTTKFTKYVSHNTPLEKDKYRMFASLAFMIVVIVVGVPMWWKTTEVYRVSLPSADILSLSDQPIQIGVQVAFYTSNEKRTKLLVKELELAYETEKIWLPKFEILTPLENANNVHTPAGLEAMILKNYELQAGDFIFIEWPKLQEEVLLTTERSAFIRSDTSSIKLKNVLNLLLFQTHRIQQILSNDQRYATKTEAPQAHYDVIVSVLNPRPDIMDAKWNVPMAIETYLKPFLAEVSDVSNFTLKSQWKFQLPFEAELKQVRDTTKIGRHYALAESSLPHIITSIEKNLGAGITNHTPINLVVYIPPCDIAPVHIYNRQQKMATRNKVDSFISPKWGGIIIANPPEHACLAYNEQNTQRLSFYVNTNDVMQIMLYQLHKILDIHVELNIEGVKTVDLEQIAPRRWEYEAYIRRCTVMHIMTATNTLQSLIKLLDNISYIVIEDNVGASIIHAYENIVRAKSALESNDLLNASAYAKQAFTYSEQAFFDASLLEQLYFPDEQKYAIYIPLFLPIMVPVITSFTMIRKFLNRKEKVE